MGKDDPTLGAQATLPDAHAPAAEGGDEAPAHPTDVDHAHPGGELDAAAVAALQGLGNGPDAGSDLSPDHGLVGDDLVAAFHGIDVASNIDHALDQLTSSADLFDLPTLDFGDHHHDSAGS